MIKNAVNSPVKNEIAITGY